MPQELNALLRQIGDEAEANLDQPELASAQALTVSGASVKEFFCQHWEDVKKVIEFLGDLGGAWGRLVARALIEIGDRYYRRNCK